MKCDFLFQVVSDSSIILSYYILLIIKSFSSLALVIRIDLGICITFLVIELC